VGFVQHGARIDLPNVRGPLSPESHFGFPFRSLLASKLCPEAKDAAQGQQELQLPHKPPHHEKNADTDPDGEQHREHRTAHPAEPATAAHFDFPLTVGGFLEGTAEALVLDLSPNAISTRRRIASARPGISGCARRHSSIRARNSSDIRI
jgi:hypothetical protein